MAMVAGQVKAKCPACGFFVCRNENKVVDR